MNYHRQYLIVAGVLVSLSVQGCVLAPTPPDLKLQQAAMQRWNACLQRFEQQIAHYCDGYRRDVLAMYPVYQQNQINALLSHTARTTRASKLLKTGLGSAPPADENSIQNAVVNTVGAAKQADL